jgi:NAD(P)-dependent dehydrogenase (short-subunit alcohol dehydrogenase family)
LKTAVVTGATSGIGLAVCEKLASTGFSIIGVGRDGARCGAAEETLKNKFPGICAVYFTADLSRRSEVLRAGAEIKNYLERNFDGELSALINNAGCVRSFYMITEDGYETQFAVNHLAGFLITSVLMPCLEKGRGRVLMTSSASHKMMKMRWNDVMFKKRYNPLLAYKQSKLANMLFAYGLNERFGKRGVRAYGIDPGLVRTDIGLKNTGGLVRLVWKLRQKSGVSPDIPADTYAFVCESPEPPDGLYYFRRERAKYSAEVTKQNADRLWALSEQLCGIKFGEEKSI